MLENYFDAFLRMTDKNMVKTIMKDFLKTCSYIGYSTGLDAQKLTQTMRRIYKSPADMGDISQLLDFCVILAISNSSYEEFDSKSKAFVE